MSKNIMLCMGMQERPDNILLVQSFFYLALKLSQAGYNVVIVNTAKKRSRYNQHHYRAILERTAKEYKMPHAGVNIIECNVLQKWHDNIITSNTDAEAELLKYDFDYAVIYGLSYKLNKNHLYKYAHGKELKISSLTCYSALRKIAPALCYIDNKTNCTLVHFKLQPTDASFLGLWTLNSVRVIGPYLCDEYLDNHECELGKYAYIYDDFILEYEHRNTIPFDIKSTDFIFGYNVFNKKRMYLNSAVAQMKRDMGARNISYAIYSYDRYVYNELYRVQNTIIKQLLYIDYMYYSKFTLIMPPHKDDEFSYNRFIEAVTYECIPILHRACNYEILKLNGYGDYVEFAENNGLIWDAGSGVNFGDYLRDLINDYLALRAEFNNLHLIGRNKIHE